MPKTKLTLIFTALVLLLTLLMPTSNASADDDDDDDDDLAAAIAGQYIVELNLDGDPAAVGRDIGALLPPEQLDTASRIYRFVIDPTIDVAAGLDLLRNTPGVGLAQPNFEMASTDYLARVKFFTDLGPAVITSSKTGYTVRQPGLRGAGLPVPRATGAGVVVAVLDTGIDATHPGLASRILGTGIDVVDGDLVPAEVADGIDQNANGVIDEAYGHGTWVAGLVAVIAPRARLLPVRVLDSEGQGDTWRTMKGIAWASGNGADVINLSLGSPSLGDVFAQQLDRVTESGVILVAAAGNDASETFQYPAAHPAVVGVTAVNGRTNRAATFANRGSWIDVASPGVEIVSVYPGRRYARWGGTSASAPVVSAAMALITAARPDGQADDRIGHLTSTANPANLSGLSAYGRVQISAAVAAARAASS